MMRQTSGQDQSIFSWKTGLLAVCIGVISFASLVVLSAFAPDLQDKDKAGLHAYSKSALGYNFAVELLRRTGQTVDINRDPGFLTRPYDFGILVLTPANSGDLEELEEVDFYRDDPILIVLPKRNGMPDMANPRHQARVSELQPETVVQLLEPLEGAFELEDVTRLDDAFALKRITPVSRVNFHDRRRESHFAADTQIITSGPVIPIIQVTDGTIFGRVEGSDIYVLSDPELMNTHGLSRLENAELLIDMIDEITGNDKTMPVVFDTTLHGFERTRNLLRLLFQPPFLGATLFMFAAGILLGWASFVRFGKSPAPEPLFATGRASLIESTAGLFELTSREASLAGEYGDLMRRQTIAELGYPDDLPPAQIEQVLKLAGDRLNEAGKPVAGRPDATHIKTPGQLVSFAKAYHQWKKDVSHGRK